MSIELILYLHQRYYTREQLLGQSQVSESDFVRWQEAGCMPKPSYRLHQQLDCRSFLADNRCHEELEFYPQGYVSWLGVLSQLQTTAAAMEVFAQRYDAQLQRLQQRLELSTVDYLNNNPERFKETWGYFADGTYGLCTRTGLPEDIAGKSLAVRRINQLLELSVLQTSELTALQQTVDLLDEVASQFAPHERAGSSRQRLVNDIRRRYQWTPPALQG